MDALKLTSVFKLHEDGSVSIMLDTEGGLGGLAATFKGLEFTDQSPLLAFNEYMQALQTIFWQQEAQMQSQRNKQAILYGKFGGDGSAIEPQIVVPPRLDEEL